MPLQQDLDCGHKELLRKGIKMFRQSGQIAATWIIGLGATAVLSFGGMLLAQSNLFNAKVDAVDTKVNTVQVDVGKLQTSSEQYLRDITGINKKLDEYNKKLDDILKILR